MKRVKSKSTYKTLLILVKSFLHAKFEFYDNIYV